MCKREWATIRYASEKEQSQLKLILFPFPFAIQATAKNLQTRYTEPIHYSQGNFLHQHPNFPFSPCDMQNWEIQVPGSHPSVWASPGHRSTHVPLPAHRETCTSIKKKIIKQLSCFHLTKVIELNNRPFNNEMYSCSNLSLTD